jgi:hypothetical protein
LLRPGHIGRDCRAAAQNLRQPKYCLTKDYGGANLKVAKYALNDPLTALLIKATMFTLLVLQRVYHKLEAKANEA